MATTNGGGVANASTTWTVEGQEGEDVVSPIFGVNEGPTIPLADTLAAARVRSNTNGQYSLLSPPPLSLPPPKT